jgi:hypothetical protein
MRKCHVCDGWTESRKYCSECGAKLEHPKNKKDKHDKRDKREDGDDDG